MYFRTFWDSFLVLILVIIFNDTYGIIKVLINIASDFSQNNTVQKFEMFFHKILQVIFQHCKQFFKILKVFFKFYQIFRSYLVCFLKRFFDILWNKSLIENLKCFYPIFNIFKYVFKIIFMSRALFLIIIHVWIIIFKTTFKKKIGNN